VGVSNTITVTPVWTSTIYSEGYAVWIDYNKDGDFADSGERVWSRTATTTSPVSGTFTVPTTAATGATRMRVSMKYNGVPSYCETFTYGEVEDYTVNIISGTAKGTERGEVTEWASSERIAYPNPVKDVLTLKIAEGITVQSLKVSTVNGATLQFMQKYEEQLNVSALPAGMYILSVQTDKGMIREKFVKE
jgi:hypothetical protein